MQIHQNINGTVFMKRGHTKLVHTRLTVQHKPQSSKNPDQKAQGEEEPN